MSRTISLELSQKLQELGAWKGLEIAIDRDFNDNVWKSDGAPTPTLSDLVDALALQGSPELKKAKPRDIFSPEWMAKLYVFAPNGTLRSIIAGDGSTPEEACAICLKRALETEGAKVTR